MNTLPTAEEGQITEEGQAIKERLRFKWRIDERGFYHGDDLGEYLTHKDITPEDAVKIIGEMEGLRAEIDEIRRQDIEDDTLLAELCILYEKLTLASGHVRQFLPETVNGSSSIWKEGGARGTEGKTKSVLARIIEGNALSQRVG